MTQPLAPSAQRQFLVSLSIPGVSIPGLWAQRTGGEGQVSVTKSWDGGALSPDVLTSTPDFTDVVITRPYKRDRDAAIVAALKPLIGAVVGTISQQATDANLIKAATAPETWTGVLTHVKSPETDAGGSAASTITLTFSPTSSS